MGLRAGAVALGIATVMALTGTGTALADGEYEPNDSLTQTAGPLAAGVNYEATQDTDNDVDWYRFYTGGQVQLTITGTVLTDTYGDCDLSLRDHTGDSLNYGSINSGEFNTVKQTLYRPGIYYLVIDCEYTGMRYRFSLSPGDATVSEVCGIALDQASGAQDDVERASRKVARAKERKREASGRRAKARAKAKLRAARGVKKHAEDVLAGWQAAAAANC